MSRTIQHTDAILLRTIDYSEADRIVTLLTREHGKMAVLARGARRAKSKFAAGLQTFCGLHVGWVQGSGELMLLREAHVTEAWVGLLSSLDAMRKAGEGLGLVRHIAPTNEADARVFDTVMVWFRHLNTTPAQAQSLWITFALRILSLSGFAANFERCGRCGKAPLVEQAGLFSTEHCTLICRGCGGARWFLSGPLRSKLLVAQSQSWLESALVPWDASEIGMAESVVEHLVRRIGHKQPSAHRRQGPDALTSQPW